MAQRVNLVIDQGTTFDTTFTFQDEAGVVLDLSTYTGAAEMRKTYTSNTSYAFTVATSNAGVVELSLTANGSAAIPAGRYVYDVKLTNNAGVVSRVIEGIATITPRVTQ